MVRILLGLLLVIAGAAITWKSEWLYRNFGQVAWAEEHLGSDGGTRLYYKLIGIAIIIFGFIVITGIWYDLLNSLASALGARPK